jgi:hypothetical protein
MSDRTLGSRNNADHPPVCADPITQTKIEKKWKKENAVILKKILFRKNVPLLLTRRDPKKPKKILKRKTGQSPQQ